MLVSPSSTSEHPPLSAIERRTDICALIYRIETQLISITSTCLFGEFVFFSFQLSGSTRVILASLMLSINVCPPDFNISFSFFSVFTIKQTNISRKRKTVNIEYLECKAAVDNGSAAFVGWCKHAEETSSRPTNLEEDRNNSLPPDRTTSRRETRVWAGRRESTGSRRDDWLVLVMDA